MAKSKIKRSRRWQLSRRQLLLIALVAIIVLATGVAWARHDNKPSSAASDRTKSGKSGYVNLNPPTESDKKETEARKTDLTSGATPPPPPSGTKKSVTPIITYANRSEVRAYVSGIFEEGGTCTATATKGSATTTANSQGFQNSNYTSCAPINFATPLSGSGWSIVVSYSSSTAEGKSAAYEVN